MPLPHLNRLALLLIAVVLCVPLISPADEHQEIRDAIVAGDLNAVKSMVEGGADISAGPGARYTALHYTVIADQYEIAAYLLEQGSDVNARSQFWSTPLHKAGSERMALLLIDNGADIDAWSKIDASPLHSAITNALVAVVGALIARGADLESEDASGSKPLHYAAGKGRLKALAALLDAGAEINSVNKYAYTPLHWSAGNGHMAETKLLLEHGADASALSIKGLTSAQRAEQRGHGDIAELIRRYPPPRD